MSQMFDFQARHSNGKMVEGVLEGEHAKAVARHLLQQDLMPIKITARRSPSIWHKLSQIDLVPTKVTSKDLHLFCRQMYTMIRAGIPLTNALKRLSESTSNRTFKKVLLKVYSDIAAGHTLSSALKCHDKIFPSMLQHIISVGESTGRLDEAFKQIGDYLDLEVKTLAQLKSMIRYPIIVIAAIVIAVLVVNVFVIPAFVDLFKNFNAKLPLFTRMLIGTSAFILKFWWAMLFIGILSGIGLRQWIKGQAGQYRWHYYKLKIPVVGIIIKLILYARFSRTLMMILKTGVPITEGIELVGHAMGNAYYQKAVNQMRDIMVTGENLTAAAQAVQVFPSMIIQMLMVGEESGELDTMMEEIASFYEREIDYQISKVSDVLEPMLLAIVGVMVLILALGVFMPIWELGAAAQGR